MTEVMRDELKSLLGDFVQFDESLKPLNSFRVGGRASAVVYPSSIDEIKQVVAVCKQHQLPFRTIGGGTNLLVPDRGYDGVVLITTRRMTAFSFDDNTKTLTADAGVRISRLIAAALDQELTGLEFAAGIPGTFGGVLWMNGGTKGGSIDEVFHSMQVIDQHGEIRTLNKKDVTFSYRSCGLPQNIVILRGTIQLMQGNRQQIKTEIDRIKAFRAGQPIQWPNAGSIFKNPAGDYAGRLIEASGLKGRQCGGAKISDEHANFIINTGSATAQDIMQLIALVKQRVRSDHNISLETELEVLE